MIMEKFFLIMLYMNREGLLGKNIRQIPEYSMLESYEAKKIFGV